MRKFEIVEIDRDYRAWVSSEILEFEDLAAANKYCTEQSWSGYDYFVTKEVK